MQLSRQRFTLILAATLFGVATFAMSWWCWWTYQYGTFDLAFYVQSLWLAAHGQWHTSLLDVPMLGNHAEPIVFLLTPFFAILPHPMLLVATQNAALATMPFTGWRIARKLGMSGGLATALAVVTVIAPATGFIALHEFHPEAFAAPLLLLLFEARLDESLPRYWLWFAACLACKENIAFLLVAWGGVYAWCDRRKDRSWEWSWNIAPTLAAATWIGCYASWLSPRLNGGRVDYGNLYAHLGNSGGDIVAKFFTEPHRIFGALWQGLTHGNLVWSLLLAFAFLPLFRPRWLIIAAPLFLQHLLSSRPSEWTIQYHYAAPFVPLFWIASAETLARKRLPPIMESAPLAFSLLLQLWIGPFWRIGRDLRTLDLVLWNREWKARLIEPLAADRTQSVTAGMPYLSHLATRPKLYSLHFVLKGLKTLSATRDDPSYDADVAVIDYGDEATFNLPGRYYHPEGQREDVTLPASDELLNTFLGRHEWQVTSTNALAILRRGTPPAVEAAPETGTAIGPQSMLLRAGLSISKEDAAFQVDLDWRFTAPRKRIPWLIVTLADGDAKYPLLIGMCAPETISGTVSEHRRVRLPPSVPPGKYQVSALFFDKIKSLWQPQENPVLKSIPLGEITCATPGNEGGASSKDAKDR